MAGTDVPSIDCFPKLEFGKEVGGETVMKEADEIMKRAEKNLAEIEKTLGGRE